LLDEGEYRRYKARPERIIERVRAESPDAAVIIDEVQRVPELLSSVHLLMEEGRGRRFVLTGSSARKLKRGNADMLAGRALMCCMHPFMAAELGERFSLSSALELGLVPVLVGAASPRHALAGYVGLYIKEEVQAEALTRNVGDFARFLEAASFSHGSLVNVAEMARECQVGRKTVESYLSILEDLLLAVQVPVFSRRARRALSVHPKLYFFDAGVFRSLRPVGPLDSSEEIGGAALEGLVAQHLRAWNDYGGHECTLHFWRTRSSVEVDFVLYGRNDFWAVEVTSSPQVRGRDLRGLTAFGADYPEARRILLHTGAERFLRDGTLCLPCEEFLRSLHPARPLVAWPDGD